MNLCLLLDNKEFGALSQDSPALYYCAILDQVPMR